MKTKVTVLFEYDEPARKWEAFVDGATSALGARQAFTAVVITVQGIPALLQPQAQIRAVDGSTKYQIIPAI